MIWGRGWAGVTFLAVAVTWAGPVAAQEDSRRALAVDLAQVMVDANLRRELDEQVTASLTTAVATTLQERLNRRLQDQEWRMVAEIARRFVAETLPSARTEELAATVYARQFDEAELRELLGFQRSAVGRKASRLAPVVAAETAQAIEEEIRKSPALPRMLAELQRAFPVLKPPESP